MLLGAAIALAMIGAAIAVSATLFALIKKRSGS